MFSNSSESYLSFSFDVSKHLKKQKLKQNWDCASKFPVRPRKWQNLDKYIKNLTFCCNSVMFNSLSWTDYFLQISLIYFIHKCIRKKVEDLNNLDFELFYPNQGAKCQILWAEHSRKYDKIFSKVLAYVLISSKDNLLEHLELVWSMKTKRCWQYPLRQDKQFTLIKQTIPVNVAGACNMKGRNCIFELDNWYVIDGIFKGLCMI